MPNGDLPALTAAPGAVQEFQLPAAQLQGPGERFVTVRFYPTEPTLWAPAGHEVGWAQLALPSPGHRRPHVPRLRQIRSPSPRTSTPSRSPLAGSAPVRAVFDKASGALSSYSVGGENLLVAGPKLHVWRGATDNDGIKLMMEHQGHKPLAHWLALGLDKVQQQLEGLRLAETEDGLPAVEVVHRASGRGRWDDFVHTHRYVLQPSGELVVENHVQLGKDITDPPRIGVDLVLQPALEQLTWYGRGPWENYSDRKVAAQVGIYNSTVDAGVRALHHAAGTRPQDRRALAAAYRCGRARPASERRAHDRVLGQPFQR